MNFALTSNQARPPAVSVIIPVVNESATLPSTLAAIRSNRSPIRNHRSRRWQLGRNRGDCAGRRRARRSQPAPATRLPVESRRASRSRGNPPVSACRYSSARGGVRSDRVSTPGSAKSRGRFRAALRLVLLVVAFDLSSRSRAQSLDRLASRRSGDVRPARPLRSTRRLSTGGPFRGSGFLAALKEIWPAADFASVRDLFLAALHERRPGAHDPARFLPDRSVPLAWS